MRKLLLATVLSVITQSAIAEWTYAGKPFDGEYKLYIDLASIKRGEIEVTVWQLTDYAYLRKEVNGNYKSVVEKFEYNCKNESYRVSTYFKYEGQMQTGNVIKTSKYTLQTFPFQEIVPNSVISNVFEAVCKQ